MEELDVRRDRMVRQQIEGRGIRDRRLLEAFRTVPREEFLPPWLAEFAYDDTPLSIEEGQTISQPYIVAAMIHAVHPAPDDRVLEIGTGSGYASAILSRIAHEVYTVERHETLALIATERLHALGFDNVHVRHGDGTLGWAEHAPYDAIVVSAAGPVIPRALAQQLAVGGRMIIPVGDDDRTQRLVRVTRVDRDRFEEKDLEPVRFVPLVGEQGWKGPGKVAAPPRTGANERRLVAALVREACEPLSSIDDAPLDLLMERIGDARVVCLGEATHGTSEFYRMRARITRDLVQRHGFTIVAVEADWPDAARVDRFVRHLPPVADGEPPFARFPTWMWRNAEVHDFVEWMREWNGWVADPAQRVRFHGLDLYSLRSSIAEVLKYLDEVDPEAATIARARYGCLSPWERDPAQYGRMALTHRYRSCEDHVGEMLRDVMARRMEYSQRDGERFMDAAHNARLIVNAERYYRAMYYGAAESWNLRDRHMFETLQALLESGGPESRAVVWAHNSHLGDARATEMGAQGELNVGQLCREAFAERAYLVGFGTDHGTVAAAHDWDEPMQVMDVRPSHDDSYERVCHESERAAFLLPLGRGGRAAIREELTTPRLERAIGVVYRPESELRSHYFEAVLPAQFDEYVWFDETRAVGALPERPAAGMPETWPFGV